LGDDEERYTFSSLMTSLIESENRLKQLYEATAHATEQPELKSLLTDFAKSSEKRLEMMRRARVESVVEIALEPITGLRLSELLATIDGTIQNERASIIQRLMTLERTISDLYARTSPKVVRISADAAELLSMLSRESTGRLRYLDRYG
jgi:hypothetical protein